LQNGHIDRQQQNSRGETSLCDTAAHGTRQTGGALQIGNERRIETSRFDTVARRPWREHDNDPRR
jgi:hypothetical protein